MKKTVLFALVLLLLLATAQPALSSDATPSSSDQKNRLLTPIADYLSGPVWLRIKGLDPVQAGSDYASGSETMQAPGGPAFIPYREPTPKFSRNIIVSYDLSRYPYQAEPHIVSNPTNPDNLVVGLNDYSFIATSAYASMDGGATWDGPFPMKLLQGDDFLSDPTLAFDREGTVYYAYMSIGWRLIKAPQTVFIEEVASILISKSDDGGITWTSPVVVATGGLQLAELGSVAVATFLDRPRMAVGPAPDDPSRDNVYVTYTEFELRYPLIEDYPYYTEPTILTTIKLATSTNQARTFSIPVSASPTFSYEFGLYRHRIVQGSKPVVGPDGKLYVSYYDSMDDGVWIDFFAPTVTWSTDAGRTFAMPVALDYLTEMDYFLPPTPFRAWPSMAPQIEVGPEGEVYAVVAAKSIVKAWDDSDIYFYRSLDGGTTWGRRKVINDDLTTRDQFFPAIAVGGNGTIHVSFADRRDDPQDVEYHIYYTKSSDQGENWMLNARVSDYPSNANFGIPSYVGDYFTLTTGGNDVYIVWTDTRLGGHGSSSEKIAFARMRAIPTPAIYLSPPAGPAGVTVTIMGFNFAPKLREVYIQVDGVIMSSVLTNDEGRFTATLFMPISDEGAHSVVAADISGNTAQATFYVDFGFGTIRDLEQIKGLENVTRRLESIERRLGEAVGTSSPEPISELLWAIFGLMLVSALVSSGLTLLVYNRVRRRDRKPHERETYRRGAASRKPMD